MKPKHAAFDEHDLLHELSHYLPAQAPLKDFIHHNTLHAFQNITFEDAIRRASKLFGYKVTLSLSEFRKMYDEKAINPAILTATILKKKGEKLQEIWTEKVLKGDYDTSITARIGALRGHWKSQYHVNLDSFVHPALFRIVCSYLDQGISIWNFPAHEKGLLASVRELERNSFTSFFRTDTARDLLKNEATTLQDLLKRVVGEEKYYKQYVFDQQFAHQGWSGIVATLEGQPQSLLDKKDISLKDLIMLELILEIDALEYKFGNIWAPLSNDLKNPPIDLFADVPVTELDEVMMIWQDAFEWTYYDQVLAGIQQGRQEEKKIPQKSFQAMFCIDDRECSIRRYVEKLDANAETFGTPGFFGVEFFYQPAGGKFYTKLCPAPVTPKYLIKEQDSQAKIEKDLHFHKNSHSLFRGWLVSQALGYAAAFRLALNIFRPRMSPATTSSFKHMDKCAQLTIENKSLDDVENDLQIGYTIEEMANRAESLLKSIGLVKDFAPIVYIVGHGSTSTNNTHYAGYDCGACSGRPGSVNARVMCFMANHPKVREILAERGINIPATTQFVGALHDTSRDDISFFDEQTFTLVNAANHRKNIPIFIEALNQNAKERSRRLMSIDTALSPAKIHEKMQTRSVSLFEPRPELNHATNALCIIGRREMTKDVFLDRRAFMNSFDYQVDPEGKYLLNILNAAAPVCGGINLEYYFSRVDNQKLGAGTKLPHNVMGLIGVANGIDGDLRPGLPSQMIEVHDPIRLMIIVEHFPAVVLTTIQKNPATYEWFINEWVHLAVINPETQEISYFKKGAFTPYQPITTKIERVSDVMPMIEANQDNLPVYVMQ